MNSVKIAETKYPVLDIIKNRWSARAFSNKAISEEQLNTLLEAARWAASANNFQPWEYLYAHKGTSGFDKIENCLMPGNQPWAKNAAVLMVAIAKNQIPGSENPNPWATHDLGMANANLLLQATAMDIHGHPMAGFDKGKLIETLQLSEHQDPICVIALGFITDADTLEEPFKTRELTARSRKEIEEFAKEIL